MDTTVKLHMLSIITVWLSWIKPFKIETLNDIHGGKIHYTPTNIQIVVIGSTLIITSPLAISSTLTPSFLFSHGHGNSIFFKFSNKTRSKLQRSWCQSPNDKPWQHNLQTLLVFTDHKLQGGCMHPPLATPSKV